MNDHSVHCAWENFVEKGIGDARVRNLVLDSWQRSRRYHIRIDLPVTTTVSEGELHRKRQQGRHLLKASRQALEQARHLLAGSDSMMMLADASGTVLETAGDSRTVAHGHDIGLQHGGIWDETAIGTNAIGTALATDAAVQIHASEHFCSNVQHWTCAAAPIHHPLSRKVLGIVDLSGMQDTFNPQNLAHAVALAQQIESTLQHELDAENAAILRHFLDRRGYWHHDGLIAVGQGGRVVHATQTALQAIKRYDHPLIEHGHIPLFGEREPQQWRALLHSLWPEAELEPVTEQEQQIGALIVLPQPQHQTVPSRRHSRTTPHAAPSSGFNAILGQSKCMRQICAAAQQMAASGAPILIEGETGVGKELFARAIHQHSAPSGEFIPVNCGGMPRELIGSELFGYARGAFTGADSQGKPGKIEAAANGTLCLDEIGEMPLDLQPWLLRVLEDGIVYRIGSHQPRQVNLRLLSSTNRDLAQACAEGRFRSDLFYRLAVLRLRIPPLRERGDDVLLLAEHFARKASARTGKPHPRLSPATQDLLRAHPWPGNVRELRNVVEMLVFLTDGKQTVDAEYLHQALSQHSMPCSTPISTTTTPPIPGLDGAPHDLRQVQREAMLAALRENQGNVAKTARTLGIARSTLYARLAEWKLRPERGRT